MEQVNASEFMATFGDCPWMATQADFAMACNEARQAGDCTSLETLSKFGREHGPFCEELPAPVASTEPASFGMRPRSA